MPKERDLGRQFSLAYPNAGFDQRDEIMDAETESPLLFFRMPIKSRDFRGQIAEVIGHNQKVRDWLVHLFGEDYGEVAEQPSRPHYWRHLINLPNPDISNLGALLDEKLEPDARGPHVRVEHRRGQIIRIKHDSYEELYSLTREKLTEVLEALSQ